MKTGLKQKQKVTEVFYNIAYYSPIIICANSR